MTNTADPNTTSSVSTQEVLLDASLFSPVVHYTIIGLYVLVTCVGICGNSTVVYLFASKKIRYTSFNMLLLNLSIADLLADIFSYPYIFGGIDLSHLRKLSSKKANMACAFTIGLTPFWVVTTVSLFTLGFISIQRCVKIRFPMRFNWITTRRCTIMYIVVAWIAGIAFTFPNFFSFKFIRKTAVCDREYPPNFYSGIYRIMVVILGLALPVFVMLLSFFLTACKVLKKSSALGETSSTPSMIKRRKAVKLLGALIIVFFVCWSPFFTYFLLGAIITSTFRGKNLASKIICGTILIALCNTVADPVVYALRGDEFRKGFKDTLQQIASTASAMRLSSLPSCNSQTAPDRERTKNNEDDPVTKFGTPLGTPISTPKGGRKEPTRAGTVDSPVSRNLLIKSDAGSPQARKVSYI